MGRARRGNAARTRMPPEPGPASPPTQGLGDVAGPPGAACRGAAATATATSGAGRQDTERALPAGRPACRRPLRPDSHTAARPLPPGRDAGVLRALSACRCACMQHKNRRVATAAADRQDAGAAFSQRRSALLGPRRPLLARGARSADGPRHDRAAVPHRPGSEAAQRMGARPPPRCRPDAVPLRRRSDA